MKGQLFPVPNAAVKDAELCQRSVRDDPLLLTVAVILEEAAAAAAAAVQAVPRADK